LDTSSNSLSVLKLSIIFVPEVSCNVLCSEGKTLLQTSDYVVIHVVKDPDTGNVRAQYVV